MNCLGGFIFIWLALVMKVLFMENDGGRFRAPLMVAIHIVTMGTVATILATLFDVGGVCIDVLNVASPAAIWGEWIASGPLLLFITFGIVDKTEFSRLDWFMMWTFGICLFAGFFIIPPQPYASGVFWLIVSCVTYLPVLYIPFYDVGADPTVIGNAAMGEREFKSLAARYAQRQNLAWWLTIILPLYTVNYIVAAAGGWGYAETIAIYQILSVLTKGLFAATTMDIHLSLILDAERALVEEKRANDARRAFINFIFHEVRTPLNSLTMGIEMIACSSNIDEADVESLEIMRSASNFMSKTLDGVLSVHKIEEGKFDLVMGPTDLSALVQSAVLTFRGTIIRKGISVQFVVSPHVPLCVLGDSARLEHVVSNLLSNAIKFSPEGGEIQLVVECLAQRFATETEKEKEKSSGSIAEISVSIHDNGPGIPLEDQSKLFNQFVQIRPLTMQAGQGSGLGLSFCKNIVTLHKGSVSVVSTPGRGSTFRFVIPFQVIESPAPTPAPAPTPTPTPQPQSYPSSSSAAPAPGYVRVSSSSAMPTPLLKSERSFVIRPGSASGPNFFDNAPSPRILVETQTPEQQQVLLPPLGSSPLATLTSSSSQRSMQPSETSEKLRPEELEVLVVDDAENNRRILMLLLVRKNIKCFGAENGRIAADLVMQDPNRFKLILMDNLMPVMNGTESCKELRRARYPYLIIGITGNVSDGDISEYHACGADMVLRKPIKPDIITKILSFWEMNPFSQWERNMTIALSLAGELAWVAKS